MPALSSVMITDPHLRILRYPNTLRDLLIRIAQSGLVQAKWTNEILESGSGRRIDPSDRRLPNLPA
jgi:hypothetical protein